MPEQNPINDKLMQLAALQKLQEPQDQSGVVKMLAELYGIQQNMEDSPLKDAALAAETRYRNAMADEYGSHRGERALADMVRSGLPHEYWQLFAEKLGLKPPAPVLPQDSAAPGDVTKPPPLRSSGPSWYGARGAGPDPGFAFDWHNFFSLPVRGSAK